MHEALQLLGVVRAVHDTLFQLREEGQAHSMRAPSGLAHARLPFLAAAQLARARGGAPQRSDANQQYLFLF